MLGLKTNKSNFDTLEVVGRGSETQLQVGEKLNEITWRQNGWLAVVCSQPVSVRRVMAPQGWWLTGDLQA